jgi:hypothetical protein
MTRMYPVATEQLMYICYGLMGALAGVGEGRIDQEHHLPICDRIQVSLWLPAGILIGSSFGSPYQIAHRKPLHAHLEG